MPETIESFVAKLQAEGVQAGQQAAEKIQANAKQQALQTIETAKAQADKILADAKTEAENLAAKTQTELHLACRDTVLRLRDTLCKALQAVMTRAVAERLTDLEFLGKILSEIVTTYAQSDLQQSGPIRINVSEEMREKLVGWALSEIGQEAVDSAHKSIDLKGTLAEAGFEYSVSGATVEFTVSCVVEALAEMVEPSLRQILTEAVADIKE